MFHFNFSFNTFFSNRLKRTTKRTLTKFKANSNPKSNSNQSMHPSNNQPWSNYMSINQLPFLFHQPTNQQTTLPPTQKKTYTKKNPQNATSHKMEGNSKEMFFSLQHSPYCETRRNFSEHSWDPPPYGQTGNNEWPQGQGKCRPPYKSPWQCCWRNLDPENVVKVNIVSWGNSLKYIETWKKRCGIYIVIVIGLEATKLGAVVHFQQKETVKWPEMELWKPMWFGTHFGRENAPSVGPKSIFNW